MEIEGLQAKHIKQTIGDRDDIYWIVVPKITLEEVIMILSEQTHKQYSRRRILGNDY